MGDARGAVEAAPALPERGGSPGRREESGAAGGEGARLAAQGCTCGRRCESARTLCVRAGAGLPVPGALVRSLPQPGAEPRGGGSGTSPSSSIELRSGHQQPAAAAGMDAAACMYFSSPAEVPGSLK